MEPTLVEPQVEWDDPDTERVAEKDPRTREYLKVGGILSVITLLEFIVVYIQALAPVMVPILAILSVLKFLLVARVFMHLKYDAPIFSWAMTAGVLLATAISICIVLVVYFGRGL